MVWQPGVVVCACNPIYLVGRNHSWRPTQVESYWDPYLKKKKKKKKKGVCVCVLQCLSIIPATLGGISRRISVQAGLGKICETLSEK
jgi:hypothetical protein